MFRPKSLAIAAGLCALALAALLPFSAHGGANHHSHGKLLLAFHTMFGVEGAFIEEENPLLGIAGDELPWEIAAARGKLDRDGNLSLVVKGVVFKDDPSVPPELRGINDETEFRAAVSCTTEENEQVVQRNLFSPGFPATPEGNSAIRTHFDLPDPCLAPAVFVLAGSEDAWFAVTGFETEEEGGEGD